MYSEEFIELVNLSVENGQYVGLGNPNAEILVVGKEAAISEDNCLEIQNKKNYYNNAIDWFNNIKNNIVRVDFDWDIETYLRDPNANNSPIFAFKGAQIKEEGKTWRKYQKLHDSIFERDNSIGKYGHDFQRNFFITEMSDNPLKTTSEAQKSLQFKDRLDLRRKTFFKSDFIQSFPVVVLACWEYIKNDGNERQIDDTFGVKYVGSYQTKTTKKAQSFYIHTNNDESKLIIHTNQLSGSNGSNELINEMGKFIKEFISNNLNK